MGAAVQLKFSKMKSYKMSKNHSFMRIIICNNSIDIVVYKLDSITNKYKYTFKQIHDVIALCKVLNYPIELVISHMSMACRTLNTNNLAQKDIKSMMRNLLDTKKNEFNTIFYKNYNNNISMCECDLSSDFSAIIQQILSLNNKILSINVFPFWLISIFNKNHCENNFETVMYVVSSSNRWDIVVMHKNNLLYNRSGSLNDCFNKNIEIKNTLTYLKTAYNIDLESIALYEMEDVVLEQMINYSNDKMHITSNLYEFKSNPIFINNIINISCVICSILCISSTAANLTSIYTIKNNIDKTQQFLGKFDNNFIKNLNLYDNLRNKGLLNELDYKKAASNYMKDRDIKLQNLDMHVTKNSIKCYSVKCYGTYD